MDRVVVAGIGQQGRELLAKIDGWLEGISAWSAGPVSTAYTPDMAAAHERIKSGMGQSPDVVLRWVDVPACAPGRVLVAYVDGMVDTQVIDQDVLGPLQTTVSPPSTWDRGTIRAGHVRPRRDWNDILEDLSAGSTVVLASGCAVAWSVETAKYKQRGLTRPQTETSVRGPDEAFNEVLATQITQIRRHFRTPALRFCILTAGLQKTPVAVAYLKGVTNPALVESVVERLGRLPLEVWPNATAIGGMIRDHPRSIFPTIRNTERVGFAAWQLAEGKVVILVDGDPFVLIAPAPLADFYRTAMDYGGAWYDASFVRLIRMAGWALGVYLPALYIALTQVNNSVLPANLMIVIEGSRAGLPITPVSEVLLMVFTLEVLREAALRLPKALGPTIGTVGAIVVGTAIVKAGVVSPQIIVLITLTALAFYTAPVYELTGTWRVVNFCMLIGAAVLGLLGITAVTLLVMGELTRLSSFGTPYFEPWAPLRPVDWRDVAVRVPWAILHRRPTSARPLDVGWPPAPAVGSPPLRRGRRRA